MRRIYVILVALLSVTGAQAATAAFSGTKTHAGVTYDLTEYDKKDGVPLDFSRFLVAFDFNPGNCQATMRFNTTQSRKDIYYCNAIPTAVDDSKVSVDLSDFSLVEKGETETNIDSPEPYTWGSDEYSQWRTTAWNDYCRDYPFFITKGTVQNDSIALATKYPGQCDFLFVWYDSNATGRTKLKEFTSIAALCKKYSGGLCSFWRDMYEEDGIYYITYYAVHAFAIVEQTVTTVTNQYDCQVTQIKNNGAFSNKPNLQSVTISKSVWNIQPGAFQGSTKLNTFTTEDDGDYICENGIVYNDSKTAIVAAAANVASQEIPASVKTIEDYAFYNIASTVTLVSKNENISVGNNQDKLIVLNPSKSLTIVPLADGGYKVTGNVTQSNYNALTLPPSFFYLDFTEANILEDLTVSNASNSIFYFATDKVVTGENVVNNGVCAKLHIYDTKDEFYVPTAFTADSAIYDRKFTTNWATMCLPFSVSEEEQLDMFCGALTNFEAGEFTFTYATSILAYKPYAVRVKSSDNYYIRVKNANVPATRSSVTTAGLASFVGVFSPVTVACDDFTYYYGIKDCKFVKIQGAKINTFRAYLSIPKSEVVESATLRFVDAMDQLIESIELENTTGIDDVNAEQLNDAVYDLNGQRKAAASRGLNIVNGKVVIVK
jgi:hypothetical protein